MQTFATTLALASVVGPGPALARAIGTEKGESTLCTANSFQVIHNSSDFWPWQSYQSSNITPPYMSINRTDAELADGFLFIGQEDDSSAGVKQVSPFILTDDNELIWVVRKETHPTSVSSIGRISPFLLSG